MKEDFLQAPWFVRLNDRQKQLIKTLRTAQKQQGDNEALKEVEIYGIDQAMGDLSEPILDNECFRKAVKHYRIKESNQFKLYNPTEREVYKEM